MNVQLISLMWSECEVLIATASTTTAAAAIAAPTITGGVKPTWATAAATSATTTRKIANTACIAARHLAVLLTIERISSTIGDIEFGVYRKQQRQFIRFFRVNVLFFAGKPPSAA